MTLSPSQSGGQRLCSTALSLKPPTGNPAFPSSLLPAWVGVNAGVSKRTLWRRTTQHTCFPHPVLLCKEKTSMDFESFCVLLSIYFRNQTNHCLRNSDITNRSSELGRGRSFGCYRKYQKRAESLSGSWWYSRIKA